LFLSGRQLNAVLISAVSVVFMAKKIPEHIAFRLAQKAKDAEKKAKAAEKKVKAAEKKAKDAEKKVKAAEKKVKATEKKTNGSEEATADDFDDLDDFDDFDDLPDLDDFDDIDDDEDSENTESEESTVVSQDAISSDSEEDDELEALMKQASSSESSEHRIQRANRLTSEGDFGGALEIWKDLVASEAENPENWRGLASVMEVRNQEGDAAKAKTARDHASRIENQAIANKTGRKMEDIVADLMDDGILNFSAGSDSKDSE